MNDYKLQQYYYFYLFLMTVLLLSEHYYPKVGGTVSYVENTAINLAKKGINVYLLVPGLGSMGELKLSTHPEKDLTLLILGVSEHSELYFNANERTFLCNWVKTNITKITKQYEIEVVHLLFGLFLAEVLNTSKLHQLKIKTVHTIHNIPPFECSNSWKGDQTFNYYKDQLRKIGVKYVNKKRIKKNEFNIYITPSSIVKETLNNYVSHHKIHIIGHGGAEYINNSSLKKDTLSTRKINILTVGGVVPHKNQHLIPEIALYLKNKGIDFKWDVTGPNRNNRYYQAIQKAIKESDLQNTVFLNNSASDNGLAEYYRNADLYIQLSEEEGFCMTVLDAIAYGIPTLGSPAGAIPEMLEMVEGTLIENQLPTLKPIIAHYIKIIDSLLVNPKLLKEFKNTYTWENAADQLINLYHGK